MSKILDEQQWQRRRAAKLQRENRPRVGLLSNGTEVVLAVRGPGAMLGEFSAIDRQPRSATVTAIESVAALALTLDEFESYLRGHGRVAARLVEMAESFGQPVADGVKITLPFSQDELAGWIGASREAVSKALGTLRAAGAIRTGRMSVTVRDIDALRRRSA